MRRKNVTVRRHRGAASPSTWPLSPCTPLGMSTATQSRPRRLISWTTVERDTFERPRQPGTEQGIDSQRRAVDTGRRKIGYRTRPALGMQCRIALERVARAQQRHAHIPAALHQQPGHDEPVATIVARPAQHRDRLACESPPDLARNGGARRFHQRFAGNAAGNRQRIRPRHFGACQKGRRPVLAHCSKIPASPDAGHSSVGRADLKKTILPRLSPHLPGPSRTCRQCAACPDVFCWR